MRSKGNPGGSRATSRHHERDILVLMLGHHVALRITETSRITIADVMFSNGKLKREISLREAVTKGGSSHSGRRSFAAKLLAQTGGMDLVAQLLGHDDISVFGRYVDLKPQILREMFENAV